MQENQLYLYALDNLLERVKLQRELERAEYYEAMCVLKDVTLAAMGIHDDKTPGEE